MKLASDSLLLISLTFRTGFNTFQLETVSLKGMGLKQTIKSLIGRAVGYWLRGFPFADDPAN